MKPGGSHYYYRRVPKGLEGHHGGKTFIRQSLGTKSAVKAAKKAARIAAGRDALWKSLASPQGQNLTSQETRDGAASLLDILGDGIVAVEIACAEAR